MRAFLRKQGVLTTDNFVGEAGAEAYWTLPRFLNTLKTLPEGTTELMCHPGEPPSQVASGYAQQRKVELLTFTSQEARAALEAAGVELLSFAGLRQGPE